MRVESLDLNLILALEAIVRLRSVSAAADELRLTQPALSRALSRLRTHFGDELVVPIGRRMTPTEFGAELFAVATDLLQSTRAFAQQRPGFDPRTAVREFAIGASDYVSAVFLTKVVRNLAGAGPRLAIRVVSVDIVDEATFDRGDVDFTILPSMVLSTRHPRVELFQDTFVCAIWSDNPLVGDTLTKETFLALRHVTTAFGQSARDSHFERFLHDNHIVIPTALAVPNFTQLPEFIIGTPFIATIHARLANKLSKDLPLRFLPPPIEIPPLREYLQWHSARRHDAAATWLRRLMQDVASVEL
jgi:LysR family transcriptional regulator, nod-box dependent transcriptional activator